MRSFGYEWRHFSDIRPEGEANFRWRAVRLWFSRSAFCALYSDRGSHFWPTPKAGLQEVIEREERQHRIVALRAHAIFTSTLEHF